MNGPHCERLRRWGQIRTSQIDTNSAIGEFKSDSFEDSISQSIACGVEEKARWRHRRENTYLKSEHEHSQAQGTDSGSKPTVDIQSVEKAGSGMEQTSYDPIQILLRSKVEDIIAWTGSLQSCHTPLSSHLTDGAIRASAAAKKGLFARSRASSPWQLMLENDLARDCESVLGGGAYHMRGVFCEAHDLRYFVELREELGRGIGAWSRGTSGKARTKWSLPGMNGEGLPASEACLQDLHGQDLPIFTYILRQLCARFDAECLVWWANLYEDGRAGRSFHHDCSGTDRGRNITIGASFGAMRTLSFRHINCKSRTFDFEQWNGDVFAFREEVNRAFEHGVCPAKRHDGMDVGPRISVVIMGRIGEHGAVGRRAKHKAFECA